LLLHDDVDITNLDVDQLDRFMDEDNSIGIVSPLQLHERGTVSQAYTSLVYADSLYQIRAEFNGWHPQSRGVSMNAFVPAVRSGVWLIDLDKFKEVGGFDSQFTPVLFEDVDLCMSFRDAGYRVLFTPVTTAVHNTGATLHSGVIDTSKITTANSAKLMEKWAERKVFSFKKDGL
jgi:GT2 family glycosyltransferase